MATHPTPHAADRQLLDVYGIAARTGTSVRFARRLIQQRRVPTVKLGKYVRVWSDDIDAYIDASTRPANLPGAIR